MIEAETDTDEQELSPLEQIQKAIAFIQSIESQVDTSWFGGVSVPNIQLAIIGTHIHFDAANKLHAQFKKLDWLKNFIYAPASQKTLIVESVGNQLIAGDLKKIVNKEALFAAKENLGKETFNHIRHEINLIGHIPEWHHPIIYTDDWRQEAFWRGYTYLINALAFARIKKDQIKIISLFYPKSFWELFNTQLPYINMTSQDFKNITQLIFKHI